MQNVIKSITEHPEMFLIIAGVILLIILVLLVRKLFKKPKHNVEEYQDTIESDSNQENEELSENESEEEYKQIPDEQSRQNHIKDYDEDDSVEDTREYRADEFNEENDSEPLKDSQEDDDVSMQMHAKRREPREWEKQTEEPSEEKVGKHGMPLDYYISENKPVTPENYQYRHGMYKKKEDDELSPGDRTFERDPDEKEEFQKAIKELTASLNEVKLSQNHLENKLDEIGKMFALMQENISKNTSDILDGMDASKQAVISEISENCDAQNRAVVESIKSAIPEPAEVSAHETVDYTEQLVGLKKDIEDLKPFVENAIALRVPVIPKNIVTNMEMMTTEDNISGKIDEIGKKCDEIVTRVNDVKSLQVSQSKQNSDTKKQTVKQDSPKKSQSEKKSQKQPDSKKESNKSQDKQPKQEQAPVKQESKSVEKQKPVKESTSVKEVPVQNSKQETTDLEGSTKKVSKPRQLMPQSEKEIDKKISESALPIVETVASFQDGTKPDSEHLDSFKERHEQRRLQREQAAKERAEAQNKQNPVERNNQNLVNNAPVNQLQNSKYERTTGRGYTHSARPTRPESTSYIARPEHGVR